MSIRFAVKFTCSVLLASFIGASSAASQIPVWRQVHTSEGEAVAINPLNTNTIYTQDYNDRLIVSYDKGEHWTSLPAAIPYQTREIIVHPNDTLVLFAVNFNGGLWRSSDGGISFSQVLSNYGIDGESVVLDPTHPDTMFAGNFSDAGVFRSIDRGLTWTFRGHAGQTGNLCALAVRPDSSNVLYAGTGSGTISKSTNGGLTWHEVKSGGSSEIPKIVINPNNPMIAYGTGYEGDPSATGVWKTTDGGEHWYLTSLQFISMWALDIDPLHPDTVYAGTFDEYQTAIYRTTDAGSSWQPLSNGFRAYNAAWNLKVDHINPSNIYVAATYGAFGFDGVYKLEDANAGIEGYVFDSYTGQLITSGSLSIDPLGDVADLSLSYGRYSFFRYNPDGTSNQTLSVTINSQLFHQEDVSLTNGIVQTYYIFVDPGSIGGQLYNDANRNGIKNIGESALSGWTLKLTGQASATTTTDVNGDFLFHDIFPGNYTVTEQSHYGWKATAPNPATYSVSVTMASKDHSGLDFGNVINHHVVTISGGANLVGSPAISIEATFDSVMNPATFNDSTTFIIRGGQTGIHHGTFIFSGNPTTATCSSLTPFQYGEEYTVELSSQLQTANGGAITPFVYHFQVPALPTGGGFLPKTDYPTANAPWGIAVADFDGDGSDDVVTANANANSVSVLRNQGDGTFAAKIDYTTGPTPRSVAVGDVDNDGDMDIVTSNNGFSTVTVLKNDGMGIFSVRSDYSAGGLTSCVSLADMYGTGSLDVVATLASSDGIAILKNDGSGSFSSFSSYSAGSSPWWLTVSDVNNDGGLDVLAALSLTAGSASVLMNIGDGAIQKLTLYSAGRFPRTITTADVNQDGRQDIIIANSTDDNILVYQQSPDNSFVLQSTLTTPRGPWSLTAGDIDADGWPDICAVSNNAGKFSYYRNLNGAGFESRKEYKTGSSPRAIAVADIDGDGDQDVVVANSGSNSISVIRNAFTVASLAGWNLLSVPAHLFDYASINVYPSASSNPFEFVGTYVSAETVKNGSGYWVKYDSVVDVGYNGPLLTNVTIPVNSGWNMIGSLGSVIDTASIISDPTDNISSLYFGYDGEYVIADSMRPGIGYWVRTDTAGTLTLSTTVSQGVHRKAFSQRDLEGYHLLEFYDASGHHQTLYFSSREQSASHLRWFDLPPLPREHSFDVRFASHRLMEAVTENSLQQFPIMMQGMSGPMMVRWSIHSADTRQWALMIDGKKKFLSGDGSMSFNEENTAGRMNLLALPVSDDRLPHAYDLEQNYPNPFNPSTELRYALPVRSRVRLMITNVLGERVDVLVDAEQDAGRYGVVWTPRLASGIYFCTLITTGLGEPHQSYIQTRKLVFAK